MLDALTLDQLRIFVAVSEAGSFSAAGLAVQRVQSAISQSIRGMEATLGLKLFDRSEKRPRLTQAGRTLLVDARRVIDAADQLRGRAASIAQGLEPELTVSLSQLLRRDASVRTMHDLARQFPNLPVRLLTGAISAPEHFLRSGLVELGIYPLEQSPPEGLEAEFLTEVRMLPVIAATHPLAQAEAPISIVELSRHVQLVLTDTLTPEDWTRGVVGHVAWRFADMDTRLTFLLNGFGWCNMPEHMVAPHIASGKLKRLTLKQQNGYSLMLHAVHRRGKPPGPAGRWLIDRLKQHLGKAG